MDAYVLVRLDVTTVIPFTHVMTNAHYMLLFERYIPRIQFTSKLWFQAGSLTLSRRRARVDFVPS